MLLNLLPIEQPISGEYEEIIFDIQNPWNSSFWSWIKFVEEDFCWVGEFRGRYRDAVFSEKKNLIVVLTSDYLYLLDLDTKQIIDHERMPSYLELTCTPAGDILLTDGYGLEMLQGRDTYSLKNIVLPVIADNLRFIEYDGNELLMECEEFLNGVRHIRLLMDCVSFEFTEVT